ncbi:MAG: Ig-like domain-containing protein [Gemmatimonadota bacterium]
MTKMSLVLMLVLASLVACATVLTDQSNAPIASVRMTPDSTDVPIGTATQLLAFPLDSTGALRPGQNVTWASSDQLVATVDNTGGVVGIGNGTATITATVKGIQGVARVRVGPAPQIALAADSIEFDAQAGQASPAPQTVAVTNTGGLTLSGLTVGGITYSAGAQNWLLAQFDTTVAPATLTLTPATGAITTVGTYTATVPIAAPGASNTPQQVDVFLVVAPGPPTTYQMVITAGNNQLAAAGIALPTNPQVTVTDSFSNPIAGLPVTFQVVAGGGSLSGATVVNTDGTGNAVATGWTVQANGSVPADGRYVNQLQATAPSTTGVTVQALAYFSYAANVHGIFAAQGCNGCHGVANFGGLELDQSAAVTYANELFDVPTGCASGTLKQVASGGGIPAETASLLINKLDHTAPAACPSGMPNNATLIPAATRDTIRAWIRAGAPLN